jgi:hypothetical protein
MVGKVLLLRGAGRLSRGQRVSLFSFESFETFARKVKPNLRMLPQEQRKAAREGGSVVIFIKSIRS